MKTGLLKLVFANMRQRPLGVALTLLLLSFGSGTIVLLLNLGQQVEKRMSGDAKGIDLVVGAKGSPLQLILSAVYHLDIPTGNIKLKEAQQLLRNPFLKKAIPVSLGDAIGDFRIVGSSPDLIAHYGGKFQDGGVFKHSMEAVLGATAAKHLHKKVGDSLIGNHGISGEGDAHADEPYKVKGVLKPTGTVLDRLVLTSLESVWDVHAVHGPEEHEDEEDHHDEGEHHEEEASAPPPAEDREITALLLSFRSPIAVVTLPRFINQNTNMMAAQPAFELARLFELVGIGLDVLTVFGALLIFLAAISVFVALTSALKDRRYDLAILRTLGASRSKLFFSVLLEGQILALAGTLLGVLLGHIGLELMGQYFQKAGQISLNGQNWAAGEEFILLLSLAIGFLASLGPAIQAARSDISKTLAEGS